MTWHHSPGGYKSELGWMIDHMGSHSWMLWRPWLKRKTGVIHYTGRGPFSTLRAAMIAAESER